MGLMEDKVTVLQRDVKLSYLTLGLAVSVLHGCCLHSNSISICHKRRMQRHVSTPCRCVLCLLSCGVVLQVIKNHFASEYIYNKYKDMKTCDIVEDNPQVSSIV